MEKLYRVNFHSKFTGFRLFLLIWAVDVSDLIHKISPIVGAGAEYELDGISADLRDGKEQTRPIM
jgi:hypothetical protein